MRGKKKRGIAALSAALLPVALLITMLPAALLTGCGKGNGKQDVSSTEGGGPQQVADAGTGDGGGGGAKGRYIESDLVLPEVTEKIYVMGKIDD